MLRPEEDLNEMIAETMERLKRPDLKEAVYEASAFEIFIESSDPSVQLSMSEVRLLQISSFEKLKHGSAFHPLAIQNHRPAYVNGSN
jgi:hypothetical protein